MRCALHEGVIQVDQHDDAGLRRHPRQRDEADRHRDAHVVAEQPHEPHAAHQRERERKHHDRRLGHVPEVEVQQPEDDQQGDRHHHTQPRRGPLERLELAGPRDAIARRQRHPPRHHLSRLVDISADISATNVHVDHVVEQRVLRLDERRTLDHADARHLSKCDLCATRCRDEHLAQLFRIVAQLARIPNENIEPLAAGDHLPRIRAPHRRGERRLDIIAGHAVSRGGGAVDRDVEIPAPHRALREHRAGTRHRRQDGFYFPADPVQRREIWPEDLEPHRRLDAGGKHVEPVLDRHRPHVGDAGCHDRVVRLGDDGVEGHAGTPLAPLLEDGDRLDHRQRRHVRRTLGAPDLSHHRLHFRDTRQRGVALLDDLLRLRGADAGKQRRHVHDGALVERRHELAADARPRQPRRREHEHGDDDGRPALPEHEFDHGTIGAHERAVHRVGCLGLHPLPHEQPHRDRHERDGQQCCRRHRQRLRPREWLEQAALLVLQREHGEEGRRDDEQRDEQRWPYLLRRLDHHGPVVPRRALRRVALHVLVEVLHHDDRGIDHRADGDGDPAKAHDVRAEAEQLHGEQRHEDADGQGDDGDECAVGVQEEDHRDERDDDRLLDELFLERRDRAIDQSRAIVALHEAHAARQ